MTAVQLLQLTDPHLFADPGASIYDIETAASLGALLAEVLGTGRRQPDAIVVTGDIAEDESEGAYRRLRSLLAGYDVPVLCLPGNHDDPVLMARLLDGSGFQYCGHAVLGDWRILLLDTHVPGAPGGRLSTAELERVDATLAQLDARPTLICLHHPPLPVGSPWLDAVGLADADVFLDLIEQHAHVRAVLAGHVHQAFEHVRHGRRFMTSPSTCAQFMPRTETCRMDTRPPGYRWLSLEADGSVETQVAWLEGWVPRRPPRDTRTPGPAQGKPTE